MSETPCCYCGREIGPIMASAGFAEYHEICHRAGRHSMIRLRAEYAALEAAHDAALAEADRYCDECDRLMDHVLAREARWQARAESAEAQLAQARADGARSMASLIALRQGMRALPIYDQIAAWQAHETEEGRSGD